MSNRPSGTATTNTIDAILAKVAGLERRNVINSKIRAQTGLQWTDADRPSVHLRWGLQQMKLRGWRSDDWGQLLDKDGSMGTGPICILEAVQTPLDAPGELHLESPEQFYLRSAFVVLERECPLYLSNWNDEQTDFEAIEEVVNKAIELAEFDEATGAKPYEGATEEQLQSLFGITKGRLHAAIAEQKAEAASEAAK